MDRLALNSERVAAMAEGCRQVAKLPDPVGEISNMSYRPSGIQIGKMRVPLGVIGIIYESRPNVTVDAGILCLKAGNAVILRGGSEAIQLQPRHRQIDLCRAATGRVTDHLCPARGDHRSRRSWGVDQYAGVCRRYCSTRR